MGSGTDRPTDTDTMREEMYARFRWAETRTEELARSIERWREELGDPRAEIADDRLSWELRWALSRPPADWGFLLADVAGTLRGALDNLVYAIAKANGADEKGLKAVQFPIVAEPEDWRDSSRRVAMLPDPVIEAVRSVQPFLRPAEERDGDLLLALAELTNQHKHRFRLVADLTAQDAAHEFNVEFEDAADPAPPRIEISMPEIGGPEVPLLHHDTAPYRIKSISGSYRMTFTVSVDVTRIGTAGVTEIAQALLIYVDQVVAVVLDGV